MAEQPKPRPCRTFVLPELDLTGGYSAPNQAPHLAAAAFVLRFDGIWLPWQLSLRVRPPDRCLWEPQR